MAVLVLAGVLLTGSVSDHKYVAVSTFGTHSLALRDDGTVWEWGCSPNLFTQRIPEQVPISDVTAISAGGFHNLALKNDGTVWAWGLNCYGQLGDGTNNTTLTPVRVQGLSGVNQISAGNTHSLAMKSDGSIWVWGHNYDGQYGDGTNVSSLIPVCIEGLTGVREVYAGRSNSFFIMNDGTLWGCGSNVFDYNDQGGNVYGVLLNSSPIEHFLKPVRLGNLSNVRAVAQGTNHVLALFDNGTVQGWGSDNSGELGDGVNTSMFHLGSVYDINKTKVSQNYKLSPVQAKGLSGVESISVCVALDKDGVVWAWGDGMLGNGREGGSSVPVKNGLTDVVQVSSGGGHCVVLKEDGTVWAWGDNYYSQVGDGTNVLKRLSPVKVLGEGVRPSVSPTLSTENKSVFLNPDGSNDSSGGLLDLKLIGVLMVIALVIVTAYLVLKK